jgi:hypothetical protein
VEIIEIKGRIENDLLLIVFESVESGEIDFPEYSHTYLEA